MRLSIFVQDHDHSLTLFHRPVDRLADPGQVLAVCNNAVDDNFNIVDLKPVHLHLRRNLLNHPIHPNLGIALLTDLDK